METLVIILIVVQITLTVVFICSEFFSISRKRESAANAEALKALNERVIRERESYELNLERRDQNIEAWIERARKLDAELGEALKVNGLLKNRTAHVEGLKEQFNRLTETNWELLKLDTTKKDLSNRQCFAEGMKAGADWIAASVGVRVEFEIDDRFKEEN